nr:hypothetical protein [Tanacetum cinerariifolium]
MVIRTLDVEKDPFRPPSDKEKILGPEVPYLSAIRALLFLAFLASHTRPDISFLLNLLARYNSSQQRDIGMGRNKYFAIFKQTMGVISWNHAEILAIHEAWVCVWLRSVIHHIREFCEISLGQEAPTTVHEDNAACISQLKDIYVKCDRTNHILPKIFFTHDLQKSGDIIVQKVRSSDNLADLFTKALHTTTFKKLVHGIRMRRLNEL